MNESKVQSPKSEVEEADLQNLPIVEGELIEDSGDRNLAKTDERTLKNKPIKQRTNDKGQRANLQSAYRNYLLVPAIFLVVTLLGGLRISADTNAFLFLKPALVCLIFAAVLMLLFFRVHLLEIDGWFSEKFSTVKNIADAAILFTLFTASAQIFNSLLPEKGLPFWIIALLFFWTLWNNLFSIFNAKRLLQSLGGLFALAFVIKYLVLASLSFTNEPTWTQKILEGVMREASFGLIDLPKFADATGYLQFFALGFYLVGLFLLKPRMEVEK
ncbi:MAG: hypothetical protein ACR2GD_05465 [Pyrinomonadaceae bacterium]